MRQDPMFLDMPDAQGSIVEPPTLTEAARVVRPVRTQLEWTTRSLDQSLPEDHLARSIWAFVERLELDSFYGSVKAVTDGPGRPASDPKVLLALWVYATADGVGSARQVARLCLEHDAYRWLRGGVPINYHMLADFRVARKAELDELLSQILASLMSSGLVKAERVAQDGVRLRAKAGSASFRRKQRLSQFLQAARERVRQLGEEREHPDPNRSAKERAARERAACERQERVERALAEMPKVEAIKEKQKRKLSKGKREKVSEARASTTDPEARVMKMADGGYRPAFNAQLATDMDSQVILGVSVVNQGTDLGLAAPMEAQVAERTGRHPDEYVVDGGFASLQDVVTLTQRGVTVYTPSRPPTGEVRGKDPTLPRSTDPPEVAEWRVRMGTQEAKALYRDRGASAECVNAQVEGRYGLRQLPVRGLGRTLGILLLVAVAHNLLRWIALTT